MEMRSEGVRNLPFDISLGRGAEGEGEEKVYPTWFGAMEDEG